MFLPTLATGAWPKVVRLSGGSNQCGEFNGEYILQDKVQLSQNFKPSWVSPSGHCMFYDARERESVGFSSCKLRFDHLHLHQAASPGTREIWSSTCTVAGCSRSARIR
ncbi:unnamed protein product [Durusdinium trenchii]|uniref:Uncharacterized protein n=1 Tax=Durusdinium trenchii TaxID=1381693 RepID=A0ABP0PGQ7_9DINO